MKKIYMYIILLVVLLGIGGLIYSQARKQNLSLSSDQNASTEGELDRMTSLEETSSKLEGLSLKTTEEVMESEESMNFSESKHSESQADLNPIQDETEKRKFDHTKIEFTDEEGKTISLSHQMGRPMVINMWATWCEPCKEELPDLQKAWEEYQEEIDFYLVNATYSQPTETEEAVSEFKAEMDLNVPIYYDVDFSTMIAMKANFLPTTLFVNAEGEVVHHQLGLLSAEEIESYIQRIL